MKIVYLSQSFIPSRTANSIHVMKMCQALANLGNKVLLLIPEMADDLTENDIFGFYGIEKNFNIKKIKWLNCRLRLNYYAFRCMKAAAEFCPDIVIGRSLNGCLFSAFKKYPTIYESHFPVFETTKLATFLFKLLLARKSFTKLIVISHALKKAYLDNGIIKDESRITVAPDAADLCHTSEKLNDWPGRPETLQVGYVGHLYPGKGMEVISKVAPKLSDVDFHIIGGMQKDIAFWQEVISCENVIFHGFINPCKLSQSINCLDICLLPNQKTVLANSSDVNSNYNISSYTSPLKMFEYMSHKTAIISSDLPVLHEVLNEKNSLLVNCQSVDEWVCAINRLRCSDIRENLAKQAYKDFVEKYTWHQRAKNIIETLS